ncbi:MAG: PrgI family protein [bacterium]|nr:PrgI family protein [bacterium]
MEQHPVPQNITSFEFRLIGDMTLKQFGFLAVAGILAFIIWELPLPGFIRIPIASLCAFFGVAFAFLPLEDRPLHRWFLAFLKAIYSPTQFIFQKSEATPVYLTASFASLIQIAAPSLRVEESRQKLEEYLKTLPQSLPTALDGKETDSLKKIQALLKTMAHLPLRQASLQTPASIFQNIPYPGGILQSEVPSAPSRKKLTFAGGGRLIFEEENKTTPTVPLADENITNRAELLVDQIKRLKQEITTLHERRPQTQASPKDLAEYEDRLILLEKELDQAEMERESLMKAMLQLHKDLRERPKGVTPKEVLGGPQAVKIVSAEAAKEVGLTHMTDIPNVVTGVVQDKKSAFLANILVEIKDLKGNSVRAFKTNKIGQFAAATPLQNGTYNLELEDPRHQFIFDIIEVKMDGNVLPPLVIYARDQADLEKERIRQSLFGGN